MGNFSAGSGSDCEKKICTTSEASVKLDFVVVRFTKSKIIGAALYLQLSCERRVVATGKKLFFCL